MLLAIDVGNTATTFGLFSLRPYRNLVSPRLTWTVGTSLLKNPSRFKKLLNAHLFSQIDPGDILGVAISSVVPTIDGILKNTLKNKIKAPLLFVSSKTKSKVKVLYRNPSEVGADRIVNARAAMVLNPRQPSLVVDFGTATTFDCVSARGEYWGGVITPGPVISAEALYQKTAKLPLVLLEKPARILGRTTLESIQAGLYHGYRGLVREIVLQLKKKMGPRTSTLTTGGQAHWILKGLDVIDRHVPHLTLLGLYHIWHDVNKA